MGSEQMNNFYKLRGYEFEEVVPWPWLLEESEQESKRFD